MYVVCSWQNTLITNGYGQVERIIQGPDGDLEDSPRKSKLMVEEFFCCCRRNIQAGFLVYLSSLTVDLVLCGCIKCYAFEMTMAAMVSIVAGVSVLLISFLTVSYQTMKAARTNPIDSLRYE